MAGLLAGCSSSSASLNPVDWWRGLQGGKIAEQRPAPPGTDEPDPNLGSIPERPTPTDPKFREQLANALIADRANAQHLAASAPLPDPSNPAAAPALFGRGTLPPPGPAPAPTPAPAASPPPMETPAAPSVSRAPVTSVQSAPLSAPEDAAPPAAAAPSPEQVPAAQPPIAQAPIAEAPTAQAPMTQAPMAPAAIDRTRDIQAASPENLPALPGSPPPAANLPGAPASRPVPDAPSPTAAALAADPAAPTITAASGSSPGASLGASQAGSSPAPVSIAFGPGSSALPRTATPALRQLAAKRGTAAISVTGFGDATSREPAAQSAALSLGLARAQAIANALIGAGVPANIIRVDAEASGRGGSARLVE